MARVHVVGNTVVDVVVSAPPGSPAEGSPLSGADGWGDNVRLLESPVALALGGCGAAPAYALARLGHDVSLSTNLGADVAGGTPGAWLRGAGVRVASPAAASTAVHVIHVAGSQRRSAYWRGERVGWSAGLPEACDWLLVAGHGAVTAGDVDELVPLCRRVRAGGSRVLFDPSPWFAGRVEPARMHELWRHVDVLSATAEELRPWLPDHEHPADLARAALDRGPGLVVVKAGPQGAAWASPEGAGEVSTTPVTGNSTGAGDCFNARLLDGLARGDDPGAAVAAAVALATDLVRAGRGILGLFPPTEGNP